MAEMSRVKTAALAREKGVASATSAKKHKLDYDLVHSLHELIGLDDGGDVSVGEYKKKTKTLLEKLLAKLEKSVSAQQLLEQQLRMKDEQLQAVQTELDMSRELFAREQRAHRCATDTYRRDLQRAEGFLRRLGVQLESLNSNFRVLDEEDGAEEQSAVSGGQGAAASEWEFGDCDIDSNVDYSELLREDDFGNDGDEAGESDAKSPLAGGPFREALSPLTPTVSRRRTGRRSSLRRLARSSVAVDATIEGDEDEDVEVVLLPGEDESALAQLPASTRKASRSSLPPPPLPMRRTSVAAGTGHNAGRRKRASLLGAGSRRGSCRLSWAMPALLPPAGDENDSAAQNRAPQDAGRWLSAVVKLGVATTRGRDDELSRRRVSLLPSTHDAAPTPVDASGVVRPALRLATPPRR